MIALAIFTTCKQTVVHDLTLIISRGEVNLEKSLKLDKWLKCSFVTQEQLFSKTSWKKVKSLTINYIFS